uniref:Helix-turn-helix domain-containing protein n=1 Tax=Candidatus Kentrum sp. DK TaxID=2126562 RepID=A0A450S847_9GAMM|nr:MAG: Helix-turn-helix domain-containing protein [Candidatus Kentron sp. DK]VFJ48082.1 MAG: Helix-turn-helix domain-containing protein [Candidatus Kentron sp. DK]
MTIPFDETRGKWLRDPEFIREYDALASEFRLAHELLATRSRAGLSQQEMAVRMGTSQSAVARLESGHKPSLRSIERYAAALGMTVGIRLVAV